MSIAYKGRPYENEFLKYKLNKSVILIKRAPNIKLTALGFQFVFRNFLNRIVLTKIYNSINFL